MKYFIIETMKGKKLDIVRAKTHNDAARIFQTYVKDIPLKTRQLLVTPNKKGERLPYLQEIKR